MIGQTIRAATRNNRNVKVKISDHPMYGPQAECSGIRNPAISMEIEDYVTHNVAYSADGSSLVFIGDFSKLPRSARLVYVN